MNKKFLKFTSLFVSTVVAVSMFAGCSKTKESTSGNATAATSTPKTESKNIYPLSTNTTLKYWSTLSYNVSPNYKNLGDTPFAKELEKKTGVKVEYLHPATGQETDAFNIMIASGDLPDIIEYEWLRFPGGPEKAIQNKIIMKHNEVFEKNAPNLSKYLKGNAEWSKMVKTDEGSYYGFPMFRLDERSNVYQGIVVRNDWLTELNLQAPTTIDEWYTVLKAFKEKKGAEAPLSWAPSGSSNSLYPLVSFGAFIGAYGITRGYHQENGKVVFGPMQPAYKDFLTTMAQWYKEGLIDKNFATNDSKMFDAAYLGGKIGASVMNAGGGLGKYIPAFKDKDPKADLKGVAYPTLKKGTKPMFGQKDLPYVKVYVDAITANSKNAEIAAKWLDYGYSEEGVMLNNFGIEGTSYTMVNGYPKYTDEIMNNPKKLPLSQAMAQYFRANYGGPFVVRYEVTEQYNTLPQQKEAISVWSNTDMEKYILPPISPNADESAQYAKLFTDIETYINEYTTKVIMGVEPITGFDKYIDQLKKMGVEKAVAIQQAALDRYSKR